MSLPTIMAPMDNLRTLLLTQNIAITNLTQRILTLTTRKTSSSGSSEDPRTTKTKTKKMKWKMYTTKRSQQIWLF